MTKILLVDDHPIILSGVAALLRGTEFEPVGQVADGADVQEALERLEVDMILLDLNLPGRSGIEVLRALRNAGDLRPIVFLTAEIDDATVLEAWQLGLDGLVLKHAAPDLLITCLGEVCRGARWIDQSMLQRALTRALETRGSEDGLGALSPREREIVELVLTGSRNQEIAAQLGITPGTVKVHLHRIYEKLGVGSRADLVIYARDRGHRSG
jgi:two-component system nitrate/nitrite response regulator NarL